MGMSNRMKEEAVMQWLHNYVVPFKKILNPMMYHIISTFELQFDVFAGLRQAKS